MSINQTVLIKVEMTAAGLYKRIYYLIMPRPKVHGHVTNENGAIARIIEFDNGFLMNIIVHDLGVA